VEVRDRRERSRASEPAAWSTGGVPVVPALSGATKTDKRRACCGWPGRHSQAPSNQCAAPVRGHVGEPRYGLALVPTIRASSRDPDRDPGTR
jgi:hypothetical protein